MACKCLREHEQRRNGLHRDGKAAHHVGDVPLEHAGALQVFQDATGREAVHVNPRDARLHSLLYRLDSHEHPGVYLSVVHGNNNTGDQRWSQNRCRGTQNKRKQTHQFLVLGELAGDREAAGYVAAVCMVLCPHVELGGACRGKWLRQHSQLHGKTQNSRS